MWSVRCMRFQMRLCCAQYAPASGDASSVQVERIEAAYESRKASINKADAQKLQQSAAPQKNSSEVRRERAAALAESRARVIQKFSKKKPAYSNCRMLAKDGSQLAACDLKKICWYVEKGLAAWVEGHGRDSEQPTIRLNFQHKTACQLRGVDADFYFEVKHNQCVGCGEAGHYLKYRCAPSRPQPPKKHRQ